MLERSEMSRRSMLRYAAVGVTGASLSGWLGTLAADQAERKKQTKSIILLWMNGGPATIDLWDLKPGHANGGAFKEMDTAATGVRISENLPRLAKWTKEMVLVRSMTSREGDHERATHLLRTGYTPQGPIQFPALGALVSHERALGQSDLPNFVSIAPARATSQLGSGFLGPNFAPLIVGEGAATSDGLRVPDLVRPRGVDADAETDRLRLLNGLEKNFHTSQGGPVVDSIQAATARAVRLMRPEAAASFDLDQEKTNVRDAYGRNLFGQGCLLARRLVERGVSFVEVTLDGWDTHQNNFERVKGLSLSLDTAYSSLLSDLKERGLLDSTIVVCQGEFGRTPIINGNQGRDHWPKAWAVAMAGGGIKGGQAIGKTTVDGMAVEERPVKVPELIATICKAVDIDPTKQNLSNVNRPIRIAEPGSEPIAGIL